MTTDPSIDSEPMFPSDLSPQARDFFAAGYRLRIKDIDPFKRLVTRNGTECTCVYRSISEASGLAFIEIRYEGGIVKSYGGHATSTLPLAYA